jgi:hypothetical protein
LSTSIAALATFIAVQVMSIAVLATSITVLTTSVAVLATSMLMLMTSIAVQATSTAALTGDIHYGTAWQLAALVMSIATLLDVDCSIGHVDCSQVLQ